MNRYMHVALGSLFTLAVLTAADEARAVTCGGSDTFCTGDTSICTGQVVSSGTGDTTALYGQTDKGSGVTGVTTGSSGAAVLGLADVSSCFFPGQSYGVYGASGSTTGIGVLGAVTDSSVEDLTIGVEGVAEGGYGVYAASTSNWGLYATSTSSTAVYGMTFANTLGVASGEFSTSAGANSTALAVGNTSAGGGTGLYASSSAGYAAYFDGKTNTTGCIQYNGTNEFGCPSDRRLKKDIEPLTRALESLLKLRGVTYDWRKPEDQGKHAAERQTGFIAQEVEEVFPSWVDENKDGFKTLAIQPAHLGALEVEAIRELKAENDDLKARVKALENARRPVVSMNANGLGFAVAGLAIAGAVIVGRRRREQ